MVELAGDEDAIEDEERQMIHSVFEFNDTVVREVMVPRPDMVVVDVAAPLREVLDIVVEHGYSRIPAYKGDLDHIEGIVYAKDILARVRDGNLNGTAAELVRPAAFVPETKRISELLREMQLKKFHMAIVFDEYGGVAGLVTLEDLIEEIVGEIVDEYDTEEPQVVEIDDHTLQVHGRVAIDEVNERLGTSLPEGEWDTVAGLVVGILGRVPEPHEEVRCDGAKFVAEQVEGHRVLSVRVTKIAEDTEDEEEPARVES
jgi:CBS domain containing-hemolysin-like protein